MGSFARRLEVAANFAIILMAIVAAVLWVRYVRRPDAPAGGAPAPQYAVGDIVAPLPELSGAAAKPRLLMVVASTCHFCTDSMTFYRELVELKHQRWPTLELVAVSRERPAVLKSYLEKHSLKVDTAVYIPQDSGFKVTLTPTLILLDAPGRVLKIWVGKLSKDGERGAIAAVDAYSQVRRSAAIQHGNTALAESRRSVASSLSH